jgi:hypothetical protein
MASDDVRDISALGDRRHRGTRRVTMAVGALVVVVVVSLVTIGASGPGSSDAAAQVEMGARTTLAKNTVAMTISGSFSVNGQTIPVSGAGTADLSSKLETMTMSLSQNGTTVQSTEVVDGTSAYIQLFENGQNAISQVLPGKTWVQVPLGAASTAGLSAGTPNVLGQLQILSAQGNTVVPLGASTINGTSVTGYQVTITQKALTAAYKRAEAQGGAQAQAVKSFLKSASINAPVIKVWLGADHLMAREEVVLSISTNSVSESGDIVLDFSHYGSPVSVTIPAAGTIGSFSAFETAAKAAA